MHNLSHTLRGLAALFLALLFFRGTPVRAVDSATQPTTNPAVVAHSLSNRTQRYMKLLQPATLPATEPVAMQPTTQPVAIQPATQPATIAQVGFVAGKSIAALSVFARMAGFDLPLPLTADGFEKRFTFIGKGGIATDQPIGIALVGGPGIQSEQMIVYVIPVKPTAATADSLKAQGATPLTDHADTMLLGGFAIRRMGDYAIFGPNPDAVSAVHPGALAAAVRGGDNLINISLDLKGMRQNMPDQYKHILAMMTGSGETPVVVPQTNPTVRTERPATRPARPPEGGGKTAPIVAAPIAGGSGGKTFDALDRIEASLDNGEGGVRLSFTAAPMKMPPVSDANRPGMPPGVFARLDLGAPAGDIVPASRDIFAGLANMARENGLAGKPLPDDQKRQDDQKKQDDPKKQVDTFTAQVSKLALEPGAMSVGVEIVSGEPVVYIVQHWSKPINFIDEVKDATVTLNSILTTTASSSCVVLQAYLSSDDARVLRLVAMENNKPQGYLDVVWKDNDVFMTLSANPYCYLHRLMAAKDEGPMPSVLSASLDLPKLAAAITAPNAPLANLPEAKRDQLLALVRGQQVAIASMSDGDEATLELSATKGLLQNAPKLLALFVVAGETASPAKPGKAMSNGRQLLLGCVRYCRKNRTWPDTLDQIAGNVGGMEKLATLQTSGRGAAFTYVKPADSSKDPGKTIVLYQPVVKLPKSSP